MNHLTGKGSYEDGACTSKAVKGKKFSTDQYLEYDILRTIFKYLNGKDLSNVSLVCRSWLKAANDEKQVRMGPMYKQTEIISMDLRQNTKKVQQCLKEQVKESLRVKPNLGLMFKLSMHLMNPTYSSETSDSSDSSDSMDSKELMDSKRSMRPKRSKFSKRFDLSERRGLDCCCRIVPSGCALITLDTYGVVINNKEMKDALDNVDNIVYLYLPEIPNVSIKVVATNSFEDIQLTGERTIEEDFEAPIRELRRCLLLFCNQNSSRLVKRVLRSISSSDKFSVWGGVVKDLHICNSLDIRSYGSQLRDNEKDGSELCDNKIYRICNQRALYVGICIFGQIKSWSVVIDKNHTTKESVEQALNLFQERVCLGKHSMGLMFTCLERDKNMFNDCNVESTIFKKLFPEVPLVGCFGVGEFGNTVGILPTDATEDDEVWYKERSTIFLIITYG